ncbi:MAG: PLP-dependent aminotransferase family protein [Hyphomicrobiales bacterium]|nr:PLP-dependent aminotransferase family protein [Hyphomicrobiales bacterium]
MIVAAIEERRLAGHARMPSSRELALSLGVARNTVVLAYRQLVDEGFLESRERSGYFVADLYRGDAASPVRTETRARSVSGPDWSDRFGLTPSRQRNIVKKLDWLRYPFPFLYGQFDPSLFPTNDWRESARGALSVLEIQNWARDLIDGDDPELIDQLRVHVLPRAGIFAPPEEIIVTVGAQQALFMLAQLFLRKNTRIGIEDPGYADARNIFGMISDRVVPLDVDLDGLVPSQEVAECEYVYVTPAHHCPTTVSMPLRRRERLLELARQNDVVIIEDGYESELSGESHGAPALRSLDAEGRVVYIGSFSKILAPGLRIGYVVAPAPVARELRALRRLMLRHPPSNNQRAAALFLGLGHYKSHLRRVIHALNERAELVEAALERHLPRWNRLRGAGASSFWLEGPLSLDCLALAHEAEKRGVLIEPGDVFFMGEAPPRNFLRLGFASIARERIGAGIAALGQAARALGN